MNLIYFNIEDGIISYKDIISSFSLFLKKLYEPHSEEEEKIEKNEALDEELLYLNIKNINYEYIRYFDSEGFILLEENDFIFLNDIINLNNIIIMIKADIISEEKMKIKNKYAKIGKEINYIYEQITKEEKIDLSPPAPLNLVLLTANPLMNGENELRTMNDFNIITSKIYKAFDESDFLKYTEFNHLTINTLKDILSDKNKRPVILHLICKSTYLLPEKEIEPEKDSDNYINLIFEEDDKYYNLQFINKKILQEEIFNKLDIKSKENIKKITLIISTPLAEDVYNLFKDVFKDFGFKNILVQPSTLSDVNFIADFNYAFYQELIMHIHLELPINDIYEVALNIDKTNEPIFCCCFHKHNKDCYFLKSTSNTNPEFNNYELYNKNKKFKSLEDIRNLIPHFYHLFPDCPYYKLNCKAFYESESKSKILFENQSPINSFSLHCVDCYNAFVWLTEDKRKEASAYKPTNKKLDCYNICCCEYDFKNHTINSVFIKDFDNKTNNNKIRFRHAELTNEKKFVPNYEKMLSFVGNNKVIYEAIEFISSGQENINIYGDNIKNLKKVGGAIIEYYKEIAYFNKVNKKINTEETELSDKNFVEINLSQENEEEINLNSNINDTIYFIYCHNCISVDQKKFEKKKIIWFSEEIININIKMSKVTKEPTLQKEKYYRSCRESISPNEYIKMQTESKVRNNWRRKK